MNKLIDEDINKWEEIIKELKDMVNTIALHECCTTDCKCSHQIMHLNKSRKHFEEAIEAIEDRLEGEII